MIDQPKGSWSRPEIEPLHMTESRALLGRSYQAADNVFCFRKLRSTPALTAGVASRFREIGDIVDAGGSGGLQDRCMILESVVTCPACGHRSAEQMPTDACQFFYDCKRCGQRLKPKPGDCCVFCSYGSIPCPPIQAGNCCSWIVAGQKGSYRRFAWLAKSGLRRQTVRAFPTLMVDSGADFGNPNTIHAREDW